MGNMLKVVVTDDKNETRMTQDEFMKITQGDDRKAYTRQLKNITELTYRQFANVSEAVRFANKVKSVVIYKGAIVSYMEYNGDIFYLANNRMNVVKSSM